ncbi:MAG: hypothetical protein EBW94_01870 [Proteobacteria bacterium]|nr:hypothetical protein [Pseudomonadota bacterium]
MSRKISAARNFKEQFAMHKDNIFIGIFASFVLGALLILTIWMNEISKSSGSTSNIQEERIALLEEQIILVDATYADFITQTSADLQLFDEEIRKLLISFLKNLILFPKTSPASDQTSFLFKRK